jgi:hypothetical protein
MEILRSQFWSLTKDAFGNIPQCQIELNTGVGGDNIGILRHRNDAQFVSQQN